MRKFVIKFKFYSEFRTFKHLQTLLYYTIIAVITAATITVSCDVHCIDSRQTILLATDLTGVYLIAVRCIPCTKINLQERTLFWCKWMYNRYTTLHFLFWSSRQEMQWTMWYLAKHILHLSKWESNFHTQCHGRKYK